MGAEFEHLQDASAESNPTDFHHLHRVSRKYSYFQMRELRLKKFSSHALGHIAIGEQPQIQVFSHSKLPLHFTALVCTLTTKGTVKSPRGSWGSTSPKDLEIWDLVLFYILGLGRES